MSTDEKPSEPWVWMRLTGDGVPKDVEPVRFPNDPTVIEHMKGRRFELVDAPDTSVFVQRSSDLPAPDEAPWIDLINPSLGGRAHSFPNDPAALAGAYDAGWQMPQDDPKDQPDKPAKRTKRASAEPADDQEG